MISIIGLLLVVVVALVGILKIVTELARLLLHFSKGSTEGIEVSVVFALVFVALVGRHPVLVNWRGSHAGVELVTSGHHVSEVVVHHESI